MRVLITNNTLRTRGGTESFVRDLARGLNALGHSVMAYTSDPGHRERLLENDIIPVATDLENLPLKPDIIHGQHHLDAMSAITALPGVPSLYHVHGATMQECRPKHPRIYHYLAMSRTLAERMMAESNIAPCDITVFLNGVDLTRFHSIRTLPARPARALIYHRAFSDQSDTVCAIREAAARTGIELDLVGKRFGRIIDHPEQVLPSYDIVFASGVPAIEALASGCAVVVLGRTSCGQMVTPENFDQFRQVNFSIAVNSPPPSADKIEAEVRRFSAESCIEVTKRIRQEADFSQSVKDLTEIYERVIDRHRNTKPDMQAESLATSRYLRKIVPLIKMTDEILKKDWCSKTRAGSVEELSARVALLEEALKKKAVTGL